MCYREQMEGLGNRDMDGKAARVAVSERARTNQSERGRGLKGSSHIIIG